MACSAGTLKHQTPASAHRHLVAPDHEERPQGVWTVAVSTISNKIAALRSGRLEVPLLWDCATLQEFPRLVNFQPHSAAMQEHLARRFYQILPDLWRSSRDHAQPMQQLYHQLMDLSCFELQACIQEVQKFITFVRSAHQANAADASRHGKGASYPQEDRHGSIDAEECLKEMDTRLLESSARIVQDVHAKAVYLRRKHLRSPQLLPSHMPTHRLSKGYCTDFMRAVRQLCKECFASEVVHHLSDFSPHRDFTVHEVSLGGEDMHVEVMTLKDAQLKVQSLEACIGFCSRRHNERGWASFGIDTQPVQCFFKSDWYPTPSRCHISYHHQPGTEGVLKDHPALLSTLGDHHNGAMFAFLLEENAAEDKWAGKDSRCALAAIDDFVHAIESALPSRLPSKEVAGGGVNSRDIKKDPDSDDDWESEFSSLLNGFVVGNSFSRLQKKAQVKKRPKQGQMHESTAASEERIDRFLQRHHSSFSDAMQQLFSRTDDEEAVLPGASGGNAESKGYSVFDRHISITQAASQPPGRSHPAQSQGASRHTFPTVDAQQEKLPPVLQPEKALDKALEPKNLPLSPLSARASRRPLDLKKSSNVRDPMWRMRMVTIDSDPPNVQLRWPKFLNDNASTTRSFHAEPEAPLRQIEQWGGTTATPRARPVASARHAATAAAGQQGWSGSGTVPWKRQVPQRPSGIDAPDCPRRGTEPAQSPRQKMADIPNLGGRVCHSLTARGRWMTNHLPQPPGIPAAKTSKRMHL